jgi:hypothetical protein
MPLPTRTDWWFYIKQQVGEEDIEKYSSLSKFEYKND